MGRYDTLYQSNPLPPTPTEVEKRNDEPSRQAQNKQKSEPSNRTVVPNARTAKQRDSLLDEITGGAPNDQRPTERFSFEIYSDLKPQIEELQYLFKKRTGSKISSSRIIREAIEAYLPKAMRLLEDKSEGAHGDSER